MKRIYILILALIGISLSVSASEVYDGVLMNRSQINTSDLANFSNVNFGYSTARSSAMGGAFTSLGADLASMSINPAGLGMYQSSDFAISFSCNHTKTTNSTPGGYYDNNKLNYFDLNNVGGVFNFSSYSAVSNFSIGFGYNKLMDFNASYGVATDSDYNSIAEVFAKQLGTTSSSTLGSGNNAFGNYSSDGWGAILAYQTEAVDPYSDGSDGYQAGSWYDNSLTTHYLKTITTGYVGEYNLSFGMSIQDKVFLGASVGLLSVNYDQYMYYDESFPQSVGDLNYLLYDQRLTAIGSGINFKIGATVTPISGLRIGLAVHTPSRVYLETTYSASMTAYFDSATIVKSSDLASTSLEYTTPTRLLAGISYVIGGRAIIAFDYQRAWYNSMKYGSSDENINQLWADVIDSQFKASNNFSVGLEYLVTNNFALRAGYSYYGSTISDESYVLSQPTVYKGQNFSAGIGYKLGRVNIDLTYVRVNTTSTSFDFYYYSDSTTTISSPNYIASNYSSDNVIMTVGTKF